MDTTNHSPDENEIDLATLISKMWRGRKIIFRITIIMGLLGITFSFISTTVYTAGSSFILKGSKGSYGSSLGGLASLAGIDLGNVTGSESEIPPTLYPKLIHSKPFLKNILEVMVPYQEKQISFANYLSKTENISFISTLKKYTIGLPWLIQKALFSDPGLTSFQPKTHGIQKFSLKETRLFENVKTLLSLTIDKKEGFINISVKHPNPEVAAIVAQNAQNLLQQEVINFKIKNAQELLTFTEDLYAEKKIAFEALQDNLASFRDLHQNISSGLFRNKLNRLESELSIASAVNEELAKQVEQARIQVRKDTPIFSIIDSVEIPIQRTSPKRKRIVLGFTFLGFLLGLSYSLIKEPFAAMRKQVLEDSKSA